MLFMPRLPKLVAQGLSMIIDAHFPPHASSAAVNAWVVRSPKSGKNFWDANGDFQRQFLAARDRALPVLELLMEQQQALQAAAPASQQQHHQQWNATQQQQQQQQASAGRWRAGNGVPPPPPGAATRPSLTIASALPKKGARGQ